MSGRLCDTDHYFHPGDFDGIGLWYCQRNDGNQDPTYGPMWNSTNNGPCPFDDPAGSSFGPDGSPIGLAQEQEMPGAGFGDPLGLNAGAAGAAQNYIQMYVR